MSHSPCSWKRGGGDPAALELQGVTFTYSTGTKAALKDVSLVVSTGSFVVITGGTGAGKSTLLSLLVPALAPAGRCEGRIQLFGMAPGEVGVREAAALVGLVRQDVDAQIVCDDVRSEMAFGLEGLGLTRTEMGQRIAEAATFLGMGTWFDRRVSDLSGGQRQTLALGSVLAMRPRLLLLDEPVAQLDPIAAAAFAALVGRANRELGLTIIVATHATGVFAPFVTQRYGIDNGSLTAVGGREDPSHMTTPPREGALPRRDNMATTAAARPSRGHVMEGAVFLNDVWFRHDRHDPWVFTGIDLVVRAGEAKVVLGGNGSGKTTLLRLMAGVIKAQRGRLTNACAGAVGYVPQGVKALLGLDTVEDEIMAWSRYVDYSTDDACSCMDVLGIDARPLLDCHPFDLSGGQQRLLALAKVLLVRPALLLLDEPFVGLDEHVAGRVVAALRDMVSRGTGVVIATHDVAFARAVADSVCLLFDGRIAAEGEADEFFARAWLWGAQ